MTERVRMLIDGAWVDAEGGAVFDAVSPSTGEVVGTVAEGTRADAGRAIDAANRAWPAWAALSAFERAAAMERVAAVIDERRDDLARALTLDQGKPLRAEAHDEVEELLAYFDMAAADARRMEGLMPPSVDANKRVLVYRVPRGVVSIISPWNWPYTMPAEILAPAIAYGNTVVWAPAPTTSICAAKLAECLEAAEIPAGVVNMVTGPGPVVGDEIAADPRTQAVGFIGSIATGLTVAARGAGKELLLEMGGNGPLVVMDDADLDGAVAATLTACFLNAGQSCTAGERILVHEGVREEYLALLTAAIDARIRIGDPFDDATTLGPVNNEPTAAKTERHVRDAVDRGAVVLAGGSRAPSHGSDLFFEATVLDGVTRTWRSRERRRSARWRQSRRSAPWTRRSRRSTTRRTGSCPRSSRATSDAGSASPRRCGPGGSTSTRERTTGNRTCRSGAARARRAASDASAAGSPWIA